MRDNVTICPFQYPLLNLKSGVVGTKVVLVLNCSLHGGDVWGSGGIAPRMHNGAPDAIGERLSKTVSQRENEPSAPAL